MSPHHRLSTFRHHPVARRMAVAATGLALLASAACGSSYDSGSDSSAGGGAAPSLSGKTTGVELRLVIGSSGDAETNAVNAAAKAWADKSGNTVTVVPAKDLNVELKKDMAGGTPPDVFYAGADTFQSYVADGNLLATGDVVGGDFYAPLKQAFTADGDFYCAPKDFSTLALQINTDLWAKAGLTDADLPKDWDQLKTVAKKLTTGGVTGLVLGSEIDRLGVFMKQAGGWVTNPDQTKVIADSPENLVALQYVQELAKEGSLKFAKQVDAGWGGEAFGTGKAAMTIEGNWLVGAMKNDYPDVKYTVAELPAGPAGPGTLTFTNCWGVAAKSPNQAAAVDFIKFLTDDAEQLKFADAFGVMPSSMSAEADFVQKFPEQEAFVAGGEYAQAPVTLTGYQAVKDQFNSKVLGLSDGSSDPKKMLAELQKNADDVLSQQG